MTALLFTLITTAVLLSAAGIYKILQIKEKQRKQKQEAKAFHSISVPLLASHFKGAIFRDVWDCPVARAFKEYFKTNTANEGVTWTDVFIPATKQRMQYRHTIYGTTEFDEDYKAALTADFSKDFVIRTIEATKQKMY